MKCLHTFAFCRSIRSLKAEKRFRFFHPRS